MKTEQAIERAGGIKPLADILEITISAVMQWGDDIPQAREWQLRVLRPEWFRDPTPTKAAGGKGKSSPSDRARAKASR